MTISKNCNLLTSTSSTSTLTLSSSSTTNKPGTCRIRRIVTRPSRWSDGSRGTWVFYRIVRTTRWLGSLSKCTYNIELKIRFDMMYNTQIKEYLQSCAKKYRNFVFRPKMAILRRMGMREGRLPLPLPFTYLILMIWRVFDLNLIMISLLASKWQDFKLRGL